MYNTGTPFFCERFCRRGFKRHTFLYVAPRPSQFSLLLTWVNESIRYVCMNAAFCYFLVTRAAYSLWRRGPIFIAGIILNFDNSRCSEDDANANFLRTVGERGFLFKTRELSNGICRFSRQSGQNANRIAKKIAEVLFRTYRRSRDSLIDI